MGSSNSRLGSRSTTPTFPRRFLSSFFCGASLSHSPSQMGDHLDDSLSNSFQKMASNCDESVNFTQQSSLNSDVETGYSSFTSGSSSNSDIIEDASPKPAISNHAENDARMEAHLAATSSKCQPPTESLSADEPHTGLEDEAIENPLSHGATIGDASTGGNTAHSSSPIISQTLPGFLFSIGEQSSIGIGVLLVDAVSIRSNVLSSSIADISNREVRRISRRMYWDALSRISFGRNSDSPTIVFTTSHSDDLGSHDRWLLDFSGDLHYDGIGRESRYSGRSDHQGGRRWESRYEMSDRLHHAHDEHSWENSSCSMGRHPRGTCSCDSFFTAEESSSFAGISQFADALFEVIEEIHRHRMSLSLSMITLPAPEAVVNSFPLKNHKKLSETESGTQDMQQCHICLVDYEEGDKIRVLPCSHEYHMSCVDKWLKEVHGVCPLCRDDVCKGGIEGSSSNSEIPSL